MITFMVIVGLLIKLLIFDQTSLFVLRRFGECMRCLILRYMVRILVLLIINIKLSLIVTSVLRLMTN